LPNLRKRKGGGRHEYFFIGRNVRLKDPEEEARGPNHTQERDARYARAPQRGDVRPRSRNSVRSLMSDVTPLFELLENAGLIRGSHVDERRVYRLSAGQLSDIGAQAAVVTRAESLAHEVGSMTHSATLSLGGGTDPCASISCRIRHVDQLAQFAAFYSDRVYIHNFLSDHEHRPHSEYIPSIEERRHTLVNDLKVLSQVRPLIEAGLIVPVTSTEEVCLQCIALGAFGADADKRFLRERRLLAKRFFKEMTVTLNYFEGEWSLACEAPEELLEHRGAYFSYDAPPEPLCKMPRILQRALDGETVLLSKEVRRKLKQHEDSASCVFGSVVFEMAVSQVLRTSYLSETELPVRVLSAISGDHDLARRNHLVQKHLTSVVPFIGDLSPTAVIRLRQREQESFLTYRQALNRAIDNVRAQRANLKENDARAIYSDVVAPELARLDRAVRIARRDLLKNLARSVGAWAGAITFGMYTGLLPDQLVGAAKVLGMTKILADLSQTAAKLASPRDTIKKEDLYFLWRVRQMSYRPR